MAIEKNSFKGSSRIDPEFSVGSKSKESMSIDDDELRKRGGVDSDDDDEFDDADSGAGSDDFDLLELGESGSEFCQVGDQTCCIPFELYDLPDLREIFSLDVWNECLTEEERFSLTKYLPDMDQDIFMRTLKELFDGDNFHFGSPVTTLFEMLKGGLCEPRVALYRKGFNFFQINKHYHLLRKYQDSMVSNFLQMREAWKSCTGYSIEEKLCILNIMRSQKSLMGEKMEDVETDSSGRAEYNGGLPKKKLKRPNAGQKSGRDSVYELGPLDALPLKKLAGLEKGKYGKQNPKGVLKLHGNKPSAPKSLAARPLSHEPGRKSSKAGSYVSDAILPRKNKLSLYDSRCNPQLFSDPRGSEDDVEGMIYGVPVQINRDSSQGSMIDCVGSGRSGKRRQVFRDDDFVNDRYTNQPLYPNDNIPPYGGNMNVNQLSDITILTSKPSSMRPTYDTGNNANYLQPAYEGQMRSLAAQSSYKSGRRSRSKPSDGFDQYWNKPASVEARFANPAFKFDEWEARNKKIMDRQLADPMTFKSLRDPQQQMMDDVLFNSDKRAMLTLERSRGSSLQNGRGRRRFSRTEETDSDSADHFEETEDNNPVMMRKMVFPIGLQDNSHSSAPKSGMKNKSAKKSGKPTLQKGDFDVMHIDSRMLGELSGQPQLLDMKNISAKGRNRTKMQQLDHLHSSTSRSLEDGSVSGASKSKFTRRLGKNGQLLREPVGSSPLSLANGSPAERRRNRTPMYMQGDFFDEDGSPLEIGHVSAQNVEAEMEDHHERSNATLVGCNSTTKKRKGKESLATMDRGEDFGWPQDDSVSMRKRIKKKQEMDSCYLDVEASGPSISEPLAAEVEPEPEPELIPPKKQYILITPTTLTGFTFSIVHLLSAVRMAMVVSDPVVISGAGNLPECTDGSQKLEVDQNGSYSGMNGTCENLDMNKPDQTVGSGLPSLTVQAIADRVRANPGDPCILETQEPLQDLVKGVLKIFSSRTAPQQAKGWKPLVSFEKSTKCWSWIGPPPQNSADSFTPEEITSPEGWGIPHKMLVKLVDAFATWLKSGQEHLQLIGSLPAPPVELMQANLDEKERFRDLRAQKSLSTINTSPEEVRAYFRREEQLRYSVPDRAFSYTAADGKKSIVAPLRRCGGKPTAKAREHFMLKKERPPHVTILCLVRDAASRLPGSIGTRADVCTLIRDSQYIVEDVSDAQVNQVVSGALDRLHYERDPCVQFDGERKLWVYLHREREEEDFEDDGTSSTKKWKRQKKEPSEQGDQGSVTVAYHGTAEQSGFELGSDLNVEPSCADNDKTEVMIDDTRQNNEDTAAPSQVPKPDSIQQVPPISWDTLDLDPIQESKLRCQENSTHDDFDDEAFGREEKGTGP